MIQAAFDFGPLLIFWWREIDGRLIADWPHAQLRQTFTSWTGALEQIFDPRHPLYGDVPIRIRR